VGGVGMEYAAFWKSVYNDSLGNQINLFYDCTESNLQCDYFLSFKVYWYYKGDYINESWVGEGGGVEEIFLSMLNPLCITIFVQLQQNYFFFYFYRLKCTLLFYTC
jgi:hypothetical protein